MHPSDNETRSSPPSRDQGVPLYGPYSSSTWEGKRGEMKNSLAVPPALEPPLNRQQISASWARMSTSLPLPSSPHCAPRTTVKGGRALDPCPVIPAKGRGMWERSTPNPVIPTEGGAGAVVIKHEDRTGVARRDGWFGERLLILVLFWTDVTTLVGGEIGGEMNGAISALDSCSQLWSPGAIERPRLEER